MSVHEYARRDAVAEKREDEIARVLQLPTPIRTGPDVLEELAELLVRQALALRDAAELWRSETA